MNKENTIESQRRVIESQHRTIESQARTIEALRTELARYQARGASLAPFRGGLPS